MALQQEIEGTSRPDAIPEIDEAAESYFSNNEKLRLLRTETESARNLLAKRMQDAELQKYVWVDGEFRKVITFDTIGMVKMHNPKREEEDE